MNHVAVGAVPKGGPLWESRKLMRLSGSYKNGTVHEDIGHHARSRFDFVGASTWQAPTDLFYWIQAGRPLGRPLRIELFLLDRKSSICPIYNGLNIP